MLDMTGCSHSWEILPAWCGRYRCSLCGVFGFRKSATQKSSTDDSIHLYKCESCDKPAVAKEFYKLRNGCFSSKKYWRCNEHRTITDGLVKHLDKLPVVGVHLNYGND